MYVCQSDEGVVCMECPLRPLGHDDWRGDWEGSKAKALAHLEQHRAAGHAVPERAFARLRAELAGGDDA